MSGVEEGREIDTGSETEKWTERTRRQGGRESDSVGGMDAGEVEEAGREEEGQGVQGVRQGTSDSVGQSGVICDKLCRPWNANVMGGCSPGAVLLASVRVGEGV